MRWTPLAGTVVAVCAMPAIVFAQEAGRVLSGEVSYAARVALPADATLLVEARRPDGSVAAEARVPTDGRQVPLPFALEAPAGVELALRAAIFDGARPLWVGPEMVVAADTQDIALGPIRLQAHVPTGFGTPLRCGETAAEFGLVGDGARLRIEGRAIDLAPVPAASGARFDAADGSDSFFWGRGGEATVRVDGRDLPRCVVSVPDWPFPLVARGNEPGWRVQVDAGRLRFDELGGARDFDAALPAAAEAAGIVRFDMPDGGPTVALTEETCRDSATGMPHPLTVSIAFPGADTLAGCGGDPLRLLRGDWRIVAVEGRAVDAGVEATLSVRRDGRIAGRAACNSYAGVLNVGGEGISFGPVAATRMACAPGLMEVESALFAGFAGIDRFDIGADGALSFLSADREVIRAAR